MPFVVPFELRTRLPLYVPATTVSIYVPIVKLGQEHTSIVARRMANMFGGATIVSAKGIWLNDRQESVYDDIDIVYSYCDAMALEDKA